MNSEYIVVVYTSILLSNNIMYAWWCFAFSLWDLEKKMLCQKISGQTWPFLCGMNIHQKVTIDEKLFWQNTNKYCCDTAHCPKVIHIFIAFLFKKHTWCLVGIIFQNSAKLVLDDSTDSGNSISPAFKYRKYGINGRGSNSIWRKFAQDLLSKSYVLLRLLIKCGSYKSAATNTVFTVFRF